MKTCYGIFGYPENNTIKSVNKKFRIKIKDVHPDKRQYSPKTCHEKTTELIGEFDEMKKEVQKFHDLQKSKEAMEKTEKEWQMRFAKQKAERLRKQREEEVARIRKQQQKAIERSQRTQLKDECFKPNLILLKNIKKKGRTKDKNMPQWNALFKNINKV